MLSDTLTLLLIAFIILMVLAHYFEEPFIGIVAGMVGLLMAFQAFADTSSATVGISLSSVGLITLVGALREIVSGGQ